MTGDKLKRQRPPFAMIPERALYHDECGLSDRAARLYAVLDRYANNTNEAWPSRETLGRRLGCSVDSVDRAANELEANGWLQVERRPRTGNRYLLLERAQLPVDNRVNSRTRAAINGRKSGGSMAAPVRPELEKYRTREKAEDPVVLPGSGILGVSTANEALADFGPVQETTRPDAVSAFGLNSARAIKSRLRNREPAHDPGSGAISSIPGLNARTMGSDPPGASEGAQGK